MQQLLKLSLRTMTGGHEHSTYRLISLRGIKAPTFCINFDLVLLKVHLKLENINLTDY